VSEVPLPLVEKEALPALFQAADDRAIRAQATFLRTTALQIYGLVLLAAVETAQGIADDARFLDVAVAVIAAGLILIRVVSMSWRSEKVWYQARAAAESLKTMAWKFMMRSAPFDGDDAEHLFLGRLTGVLRDLPDQPITPPAPDAPQVTPTMRTVRSAQIGVRIAVYRRHRIEDQAAWYTARSAFHDRRARVWEAALLGLLLVELVLAIVRISGGELPVSSLIATGVATITTWTGARNFASLAAAYAVAAHELLAIRSEMEATTFDESTWGTFVNDAEEAISREHTTWSASRQT
jgi:SMODS and SLOG-associating 2TM effector domain 3/SMODS and SLOG-associating 2TM effector domain 1